MTVATSRARRYLVAAVAPGLSALVLAVLWTFTGRNQPSVFIPAVMLSAWYGGIGPGLVSTAVSLFLMEYMFEPPFYTVTPELVDLVRMLIFSGVAVFVSVITAQKRRFEGFLRQVNEQLEARVHERTEALLEANRTLTREVAERERAERAATALARVSRILAQSLDVDAVAAAIVGSARELLDVGAVRLYAVDPRSGAVLATLAEARDGARFDDDDARLLAWRAATAAETVSAGGRPSDRGEIDEPRRLAVPLRIEDQVLGVLVLAGARSSAGDGPRQLVRAFADQAALALKNAQAHRTLSETQEQLLQAQKMEAVGRLAAGIAHDFNNLLTAITMRSEFLLAELPGDHRGRHDVEMIKTTAERAGGFVAQLLALGRRQVLRPTLVDLGDVAGRVTAMVQRLMAENIEMVLRRAAEPCVVEADEGQIEQVLLNLVLNARDAMPGGGRLSVETGTLDVEAAGPSLAVELPAGPYATLVVQDSGAGMDADTLRRIFDPFFTTKGVGEGTGLGLSTAYGIVKQHGGDIAVESAPGQGSRFTVYLPRRSASAASTTIAPALDSRGHETILVVEDNDEVRQVTGKALGQRGYAVILAANAAEAERLAADHSRPIDLMLSDVMMPGLTGPDLARRLRERHPGLRVLYMSGYAGEALGRQGILEPGCALLQKPFTADELIQSVRQLLDSGPP